MGVFPSMPVSARKYQQLAVIFGKLSYSQAEGPKKTLKSGSKSFHRLLRGPAQNHTKKGSKQTTPKVDSDKLMS